MTGEQVTCQLNFQGLGTSTIIYASISPAGYALLRIQIPIQTGTVTLNPERSVYFSLSAIRHYHRHTRRERLRC